MKRSQNAQHNLANLVALPNEDEFHPSAAADSRAYDGAELSDVWDRLDGTVYRVVDEDGVNVAGGQCRQLNEDNAWIYVDDTDGFTVLDYADVCRLLLVPDRLHKPAGWTASGDVVDL